MSWNTGSLPGAPCPVGHAPPAPRPHTHMHQLGDGHQVSHRDAGPRQEVIVLQELDLKQLQAPVQLGQSRCQCLGGHPFAKEHREHHLVGGRRRGLRFWPKPSLASPCSRPPPSAQDPSPPHTGQPPPSLDAQSPGRALCNPRLPAPARCIRPAVAPTALTTKASAVQPPPLPPPLLPTRTPHMAMRLAPALATAPELIPEQCARCGLSLSTASELPGDAGAPGLRTSLLRSKGLHSLT